MQVSFMSIYLLVKVRMQTYIATSIFLSINSLMSFNPYSLVSIHLHCIHRMHLQSLACVYLDEKGQVEVPAAANGIWHEGCRTLSRLVEGMFWQAPHS